LKIVRTVFVNLLVLTLALAACNPAPAPVDGPYTEAAPGGLAGEAGPRRRSTTPLLWADELQTCEAGQVVTIHWSREAVAKGPASIELGEGAGAGVFARIGDAGSKPTGPWASPGVLFVLRGEGGEVRARLVLAAPATCGD
jgi:hypothetical protein